MSLEDSGKKPASVGPWGGQGGHRWDDGTFSTIRQFVVSHGAGIDSIQIEYDKKGTSIWSAKHGGTGGTMTDKVKLGYPDEYLTSIHGHYGSLYEKGPIMVRSLTIQSNKKTYGPFGVEKGTHFSIPVNGGKIVGFHGRSGWFLDAIGVYLKPTDHKKQNLSTTLVHNSQNYITKGSENINGYKVIQGNIGQNYDIVLAVRQRDDFVKHYHIAPKPALSTKISPQSSDSDSDTETKSKKHVTIKLPSLKKVEGVVSSGPWGGPGGTTYDDGAYAGIKQINLSRNVGIVSIRVLYDCVGESTWGSKQGGTGGFKHDKIIFDYPNEILTHVTGHYGPIMYMGPNIIRSLTFHTTKGQHGPYGEEQGTPFSSKLKEGKVVGFHGRKGLFLDAIGVHVVEGKVTPPAPAPATSPAPVVSNCNALVPKDPPISEIQHCQWSNKLLLAKKGPSEELACGVVKEPAPFGPGPWGGDGGRPWDDGVFSGIKQIFITKSAEAICSIQIEYDRNGQSVWSVKHGGHAGTSTHRVKLEYPHEVLSCVSGYYGPVNGRDERSKAVKSLAFYTSRGKYGPFGEEIGTFFTSSTTEGKVVGFHGRSSLFLDAIGVHMQHWLGHNKTFKASLFKLF